MLSWLKGKIKYKDEKSIILEINNLGYKIFVTEFLLDKIRINQEIQLHTHLYSREDTLELYGFASREELNFFRQLISVSGIGPKSALAILSLARLEELKKAISHEDTIFLTKVSGIGKKTAERIILELREKITRSIISGEMRDAGELEIESQALDALVSLGYPLPEVRKALREIPEEIKGVEGKIREALKILSH
jgi:Holliday junction DNA helicase RuvA